MKTFTQDDVLKAVREEVAKTSLRQTAARIGVSAPFLSDVLRGNRAVSDTIAKAFGFHKEVVIRTTFRRIA